MVQNRDWVGDSVSVYATLGASNHVADERQEDDYYATDPYAMRLLLENESFAPNVWECACGEGHLSKVLEEYGYNVKSTDIVYRGYGEEKSVDFLTADVEDFDGDIITNPPYKYAQQFIERALEIVHPGRKVAMFLKLQFLEGQARRKLFQASPPRTVYVSSSRLKCAKNGRFDLMASSAVAYAWFVWEKGNTQEPVIKWIN